MAICKKLSYIFVTFFFINYSSALADFSKLSDVKITTMDFLLSKFDNFFIKNKHKILGYNPFSIRYQSINYYVIYKKDEHIEVFLEAVMDRKRYREKHT